MMHGQKNIKFAFACILGSICDIVSESVQGQLAK